MSRPVHVAMEDHRLLAQFVAHCNLLCAAGPGPLPRKAVEATQTFTQQLCGHMAYEERRLFPVLAATPPTPATGALLAELEAEHRVIEDETRRLSRALARNPQTDREVAAVRKQLRDLAKHLEKHSAKENELFPSLL